MKKIAFFAPDVERMKHIKNLLSEYEGEIEFVVCTLNAAVKKAKQLVGQGVDIIVARGQTARMIREAHPDILVFAVPVSGFDLAMALDQARSFGRTVAVVSFPSLIRRIEELAKPLSVKMLKYELSSDSSEKTIAGIFDAAIRAGADVVLGGFAPTLIAERHSIPHVTIPTSDEAYVETFHRARSFLKSIEQERARIGFIEGILGYSREGIVSIDQSGVIRLMNPVAERILKHRSEKGKNLHIKDVCAELGLEAVIESGNEERDKIIEVCGSRILCNKAPLLARKRVIGAVATFQEINRIQNMEGRIRKEVYARGHVVRYSFDNVQAIDAKTKEIVDLAKRIAKADANVLIIGETGTGKEVFAQSIHQASQRAIGPFVAVNCAALPATLLESELFGYVEGAFTGAKKEGKPGLFEIAHKGTLFLDEIAEMNIVLQSRLLRALQERAIMRLGSDRIIPVDVRIIAATHNNLDELVGKGRFRRDLYYRLNILNLYLPPLRERRKDIPVYAQNFLDECSEPTRRKIALSPTALRWLGSLDWPGNIRELRNMMERVAAMTTKDTLNAAGIKSLLQNSFPPSSSGQTRPRMNREERELRKALSEAEGDLNITANTLGISRVTLWRRMSRYAIDRKEWMEGNTPSK